MNKIILGLIIAILTFFTYTSVANGYTFLKVQVPSLSTIQEKNRELTREIDDLNQTKDQTYPAELAKVSQAGKDLLDKKNDYTSLVGGENTDVTEYKKYQIEALWITIGNYATKDGVTLSFSIAQSSSGTPNVSDIIFKGQGEYSPISDFISDIEKDDTLNFSIEDFSLEPQVQKITNGRTLLNYKFKVKDVSINLDNLKVDSATNSDNMNNSNNDTANNTTNP